MSPPNIPDEEPFSQSKLLARWKQEGGTEGTFLLHKSVSLNDYEEGKLLEAGISITDCEKLLERTKGLVGAAAFSEMCADEALRANERATKGKSYLGAKPKNPTAFFIGLCLHRVGEVAKLSSGGVLSSIPAVKPAKTSTPPSAPQSPQLGLTARLGFKSRKDELAAKITDSSALSRDALIYSSTLMVHASLPHRDPQDQRLWVRKNGNRHLIIQAGSITRKDGETVAVGLPHGVIPRLILHYITDQVYRFHSRKISLGRNIYQFLKKLGLSDSQTNYKEVRDQITRLTMCQFRLVTHSERITRNGSIEYGENIKNTPPIIEESMFWWEGGSAEPQQDALFESFIIISESYFTELTRACMPLDVDALRCLKKSSIQLDLYAWLTYKVFLLKKFNKDSTGVIRYSDMTEQFGLKFARADNFRQKLKDHLEAIKKVWRGELNYELTREGFVLKSSTLQIENNTTIDINETVAL